MFHRLVSRGLILVSDDLQGQNCLEIGSHFTPINIDKTSGDQGAKADLDQGPGRVWKPPTNVDGKLDAMECLPRLLHVWKVFCLNTRLKSVTFPHFYPFTIVDEHLPFTI